MGECSSLVWERAHLLVWSGLPATGCSWVAQAKGLLPGLELDWGESLRTSLGGRTRHGGLRVLISSEEGVLIARNSVLSLSPAEGADKKQRLSLNCAAFT